jgi:hypothetical protein
MNAHSLPGGQHRQDSAEIRPAQGSPLTLLLCAALVATCSAAAVILALPYLVGTGTDPAAGVRAVMPSDAPKAPFHERYAPAARTAWIDTLNEAELAQWRMRASD